MFFEYLPHVWCFPELSNSVFVTIVHRIFRMKIILFFFLEFPKISSSHLEQTDKFLMYSSRTHWVQQNVTFPTLILKTSLLPWLKIFLTFYSSLNIQRPFPSHSLLFSLQHFSPEYPHDCCFITCFRRPFISHLHRASFPKVTLYPFYKSNSCLHHLYPAMFFLTVDITKAIMLIYLLSFIYTYEDGSCMYGHLQEGK